MSTQDNRALLQALGLHSWAIDLLAAMAVEYGYAGPREMLQDVLTIALKGVLKQRLGPAGSAPITIGQAINAYHQACADGARSRARFAEAVGPDTPLEEITDVAIDAFLRGPGMTETLVDQHVEALGPFFDWCASREYLTKSPMGIRWGQESPWRRSAASQATHRRPSVSTQERSPDSPAPGPSQPSLPAPVVMLDDYRRH